MELHEFLGRPVEFGPDRDLQKRLTCGPSPDLLRRQRQFVERRLERALGDRRGLHGHGLRDGVPVQFDGGRRCGPTLCLTADQMRSAAINNVLIFVDGVDEHHARDFGSIRRRESADDESAVGLSDENVGSCDFQFPKRCVELQRKLRERARLMAGIAPGIPGAIVAAHARGGGHQRLDQRPDNRHIAGA